LKVRTEERCSFAAWRGWLMFPPLLLAVCLPVSASLGGDVSSVQADQARMKGSVRLTQRAAYAVHEIQAASGAVVREYVSPEGKVFAVAWQGSGHPDMRQLLGSFFEQFQRAVQTKSSRRAPVLVHESGLVVEIGGVPRRFAGRAYVPQMVPQGVSIDNLR
jgi:hypothetical protein